MSSETAYALLIDAIDCLSEGIALFDAAERLVLCNRRYRELFRPLQHAFEPVVTLEQLMREAARVTPNAELARATGLNFRNSTSAPAGSSV
jgi:hypothetical protein